MLLKGLRTRVMHFTDSVRDSAIMLPFSMIMLLEKLGRKTQPTGNGVGAIADFFLFSLLALPLTIPMYVFAFLLDLLFVVGPVRTEHNIKRIESSP